MRIAICLLAMAIFMLWVRVLNVEDGMRKTSDAIKLLAGGITEVKHGLDNHIR